MKKLFNLRSAISLMLICFTTLMTAQETKKVSIADLVYSDYKKNGIEKALQRYAEVKKKEAAKYQIDERELNRIGYVIMEEDKDLESAEKVFRLNMEEYPEAGNPRDSYGDYLLAAGNAEEARKYFQESIDRTQKGKGSLEDTRLYYTSLGKLAHIENRHRKLDFLLGDWDVDMKDLQNGEVVNSRQIRNSIFYDEGSNIIIADFKELDGKAFAKRVIVYDAVDDEFDIAYIGSNEILGLWPSTMKVKDLGNNSYEAIEEYVDEANKQVKIKHNIKKTGDAGLVWDVYIENKSGVWEKASQMMFTKKG